MLSIIVNIVFAASLALHAWDLRRMQQGDGFPNRMDYIYAGICGIMGSIMFATFTVTMKTSLLEGILDGIIGFAALAVCVWSLTTYKQVKRGY